MEVWVHVFDYVGMGYAFSNPAHILPSVKLSYSGMNGIVIQDYLHNGRRVRKWRCPNCGHTATQRLRKKGVKNEPC